MIAKRMSLGLRVILVMALVLGLGIVSASVLREVRASGTVNIVIDADPSTAGIQNSITVQKDQQFTVNIVVQPQGGQAVNVVDGRVNFDTSYLQVDQTKYDAFENILPPAGSLFGNPAYRLYDNTNGYADYSDGTAFGGTDPTTEFPLYYIVFNATALTPAEGTQLTFNTALPRVTDAFLAGTSVKGTLTGITVNVQAAPSNLNFTTNPANGQITAGSSVTFTPTFDGGPVTSWAWDFDNDGVTDSTEQAPTYNFGNTAGTYTVKVTASNTYGSATKTIANAVTVSAAAPSKLGYNPAPTTPVTAGDTWTAFKVEIQDAYGNITTSTSTVSVTPSSGAFATGTTSKAAVAGVATFSDLSFTTASTITVTASSGALTNAVSGNIVVNPAAASKLAFTTQPASTGSVDVAFTTQPVVQIQDAYGNLRTADTATVTLTDVLAADDSTDGAGTLTGTAAKAAVGGIATFTDVGYTKLDTIHLKATASGVTAAASTTNITLTVGAANKLAYNPAPTSPVTAGATWTTFKVEIQDQYGNLRSADTNNVSIAPSAGAFASGTTTKAAVAGVATFDDITYTTATGITVTASSGGLTTAVSGTITIDPAAANKLVFTTQPASTGSVDVAFTTQPVVQIQDQYGNLRTADTATVTLTDVLAADDSTDGAGTLTGTAAKAAVGGVATFTDVGYTKLDTIHLKATASGVTAAASTTNITLTPGAANKLVYNPAPTSPVTAGATWTTFKVEIRDQYDNVTTSTANVTVAPSAGAFASGTTTKAAVAGVATFDNLTYTTASDITVTASSGALTTAVSGTITIDPAALNNIVVSPTQPEVVVTTTQQYTAVGKDQYNNSVSPQPTFTWNVANATAGSINASSGLFTAGNTPGTYTNVIQATANSITGTASVKVTGATVTVTAKLQGGIRPTAGYDVPLTLKLYDQATVLTFNNILTEAALTTVTKAGGEITISNTNESTKTITLTVTGLPTGTYNVTLFTPHALITLKNAQVIASSGTSFDMGTLLEGNANDDVQIAGADFSLLLNDYLQTPGGAKWNDGRADFDRNGQVTSIDFSLLADNFSKTSPQTVGG